MVNYANGDARSALNALEYAAFSAAAAQRDLITIEDIRDALAQRQQQYHATGEAHYDTISAFIKSIRGSDPDAAIYWLARMLEHG